MIRPLSFQGKIGDVSVDPAPDLPDFVHIDFPNSMLYANPSRIKQLICDLSEDELLFSLNPGLSWSRSVNSFFDKVVDALRYKKKAELGIEALLKNELNIDLAADAEYFGDALYSHELLLERGKFRQDAAYHIYQAVNAWNLYRKGYLFYNASFLTNTTIVLMKIKL